jgi:hypothetical protein
MVTYDSFRRVAKFINPSEYRVVVDEYQELLSDYGFRNKAVDSLLFELKQFNYITYLSATPINPEFTPDELNDLPCNEIVWENLVRIKPIRYKTNKPYNAVVNIINRYRSGNAPEINGVKSTEAYFFINSVNAIVNIIENADLKPCEVKIICSDSSANRSKLGEYEINEVLDENKPFTFITSTSYSGCDFYSKTGVIFIVSNCYNSCTLQDVSTEIFQIAGRIRNAENPFNRTIFHIFNNNTAALSEEDFDKIVETKTVETNSIINDWQKLNSNTQSWVKKKINAINETDYAFFDESTNKIVFNDFKRKNELFKFNVINNIYRNGISIRDAYVNAGYDTEISQIYANFTDGYMSKATKKTSFYELCKEYVEILETKSTYEINMRLVEIAKEYPLIDKAFSLIGLKRMRALGFKQTAIKNEILNSSPEAKNAVFYELKKNIRIGERYLNSDLKVILQNIYNKLAIKKNAKASDINLYYDVNETKISINNKRLNGVEIIRTK